MTRARTNLDKLVLALHTMLTSTDKLVLALHTMLTSTDKLVLALLTSTDKLVLALHTMLTSTDKLVLALLTSTDKLVLALHTMLTSIDKLVLALHTMLTSTDKLVLALHTMLTSTDKFCPLISVHQTLKNMKYYVRDKKHIRCKINLSQESVHVLYFLARLHLNLLDFVDVRQKKAMKYTVIACRRVTFKAEHFLWQFKKNVILFKLEQNISI